MNKALVIGAGDFGKHLIRELLANGWTVDVLDKEDTPRYAFFDSGCRYIQNNAWNLPLIEAIRASDYDCCYVCLAGNQSMNLHVLEDLRKAGARRIVIRVKCDREAELFRRAGADQVVCPAQVASRILVQEISECGGLNAQLPK